MDDWGTEEREFGSFGIGERTDDQGGRNFRTVCIFQQAGSIPKRNAVSVQCSCQMGSGILAEPF